MGTIPTPMPETLRPLVAAQFDRASAAGLLTPGNINLFDRPVVKNPDGSVSTVRSMSFQDEQNGPEILIPTVIPDASGKYYVDMQGQPSIDHYRKSGEHLGMFDTPDNATAYAQRLHDEYAAGKFAKPKLATSRTSVNPDSLAASVRTLMGR